MAMGVVGVVGSVRCAWVGGMGCGLVGLLGGPGSRGEQAFGFCFGGELFELGLEGVVLKALALDGSAPDLLCPPLKLLIYSALIVFANSSGTQPGVPYRVFSSHSGDRDCASSVA
jgi:hypothetical protein